MKLAKQGHIKRLGINMYGQEIAEVKSKEWQEAIEKSRTSELTTQRPLIKFHHLTRIRRTWC